MFIAVARLFVTIFPAGLYIMPRHWIQILYPSCDEYFKSAHLPNLLRTLDLDFSIPGISKFVASCESQSQIVNWTKEKVAQVKSAVYSHVDYRIGLVLAIGGTADLWIISTGDIVGGLGGRYLVLLVVVLYEIPWIIRYCQASYSLGFLHLALTLIGWAIRKALLYLPFINFFFWGEHQLRLLKLESRACARAQTKDSTGQFSL